MIDIALCMASRTFWNKGSSRCIESFQAHCGSVFHAFEDTSESNGAAVPCNKAIMSAYHALPTAKFFVVGADDVVCITPRWDDILRKSTERFKHEPFVLMLDEGRKSGELLCHPVFSRRWIDILGYAVPPGYAHYYSDTDVERVARLASVLHYVPEFKIEHHIGSNDADWRSTKLALMEGDRLAYIANKARQERDAEKLRAYETISRQEHGSGCL